jgi:hypothetical protein
MPDCIPISPVQVDGHTRAAASSGRAGPGWRAVEQIWGRWGDEDYVRAHRKRGGVRTRLLGGTDALVTCGGYKHRTIHMEFPKRAHVIADLGSGALRLQLHAPELWSRGPSSFAEWRDRTTYLFGAEKWRVTGVELCRDLIMDKPFALDDAPNWLGQFKRRPWIHNGELETLDLGKRSSPESFCIYMKTVQLSSARKAEVETYEPTWEANGWKGEPVWRVEVRLARRGLDCETGTWRDVDAWTKEETALAAWDSSCTRHRLVVPSGRRRDVWDTDPRWEVVANIDRERMLERVEQAPDLELAAQRAMSQATKHLARALELAGDPDPWGTATKQIEASLDGPHGELSHDVEHAQCEDDDGDEQRDAGQRDGDDRTQG